MSHRDFSTTPYKVNTNFEFLEFAKFGAKVLRAIRGFEDVRKHARPHDHERSDGSEKDRVPKIFAR